MRLTNFFFCFLSIVFAYGSKPGWALKNPFEHKCYIENVGQYQIPKEFSDKKVLFAARSQGTTYFITQKGILLMQPHLVEFSRKEKKLFGKSFDPDEENRMKADKRYEFIEFENANPFSEIATGTQTQNYYTYNDPTDKTGRTTIRANAYKTILLKDIYHDIDLLYEFLPDSTGIKYSFIVHPGANPNDITIHFTGNTSLLFNKEGNVLSTGVAGKFIHHKPETFVEDTHEKIESKYQVSGQRIKFDLGNYRTSETIVIDPWIASTTFTGGAKAFDVDYDSQGNVYIHGGEDISSINCGLCKYSPSGSLLWTFYPNWGFNGGTGGYYGDFAIDITSGSIYVVEGFNSSGAEVIKLNPGGSIMASFVGDPSFIEMWRISFSRCSNSAVIAGGGISSPTYQTSYLDSNLTNLVMVQYINSSNCCHDVNCLALDNFGNCYQVTNNSSVNDGVFSNQLVKLPLPALNPPVYNVSTGYAWNEAASILYYHIMNNGYNGIVTSNTNVYTYDGYVVKKWDGPTGNLLQYKRVSYPPGGDSSVTRWGGITSDDCDHIFVGDNKNIRQYDVNLNLVNSFAASDTIYDVRLGYNGNLYACGSGFVQTFTTSVNNCNFSTLNFSTAITQPICNQTTVGSATITVNSGTPPFTIVWGTTPTQTGNVATNLSPGIYTVSITDNSCMHAQAIDTVVIASGTGFNSTPNVTQISCNGANDGSISITNTGGGIPPFTYAWSTGQTSSSIANLGPGTYTVAVGDSTGCKNNLSIVVTQPLPITYTSLNDTIKCKGDTTSVSILVSGGTNPYNVAWNTTPPQTGLTLHGASAGNYSFSITDTKGCVKNGSVSVIEGSTTISASTNANSDCSGGNNGSIVLSINGGVPPYSYSWSTNPVQTTTTASGLAPGIYTVTVTDNFGCMKKYSDTVKSFSPLTNSFTSVKPCAGGNNGSIVANAAGGTGTGVTYQWNGNPSLNTNALHNLAAGSYTLLVSSSNCSKTFVYALTEKAPADSLFLTAKYCVGEPNVMISLHDSLDTPYQWLNSGAPAGNSQTISVPYSALQNYSATWYHNGCKYISTVLVESVYQNIENLAQVNIFTPNGDGKNEVFYPFEIQNSQTLNDLDKITETYALVVFDRWGKKMFETSTVSSGWNGKNAGGADAPAGVYYWIATAKTNCGSTAEKELKGFVHLER